ncbi:MAG: HAD domain-containing protein [Burkholderiaceae bacterium]
MSTPTLFLDFDGVLHSMSGYRDEAFCKLPLLEDLISDIEVDIVVSSSWRFQHSLDELRALLGKLGQYRYPQAGKER